MKRSLATSSIFRRAPRFDPSDRDLDCTLASVAAQIRERLDFEAEAIERLPRGQGLSFALRPRPGAPVRYRLKLRTHRGYPSTENLRACGKLLEAHGVPHPRLVLADDSDSPAPYGYLVQEWIEGEDSSDRRVSSSAWASWTADAVASVRSVHEIRMDAFGALAGDPTYHALTAYYRRMFEDVDASFASVLDTPASLWDLSEAGVVDRAFLDRTEHRVHRYVAEHLHDEPATLLHGDLLPGNLVYQNERRVLIDWDEARAGWWPYEVARLSFYFGDETLVRAFLERYTNGSTALAPHLAAIRLEHARMLLRRLFQVGFDAEPVDQLKLKAEAVTRTVDALLSAPLERTGRIWT